MNIIRFFLMAHAFWGTQAIREQAKHEVLCLTTCRNTCYYSKPTLSNGWWDYDQAQNSSEMKKSSCKPVVLEHLDEDQLKTIKTIVGDAEMMYACSNHPVRKLLNRGSNPAKHCSQSCLNS
jgi:hypothetical protein